VTASDQGIDQRRRIARRHGRVQSVAILEIARRAFHHPGGRCGGDGALAAAIVQNNCVGLNEILGTSLQQRRSRNIFHRADAKIELVTAFGTSTPALGHEPAKVRRTDHGNSFTATKYGIHESD